VGILFAGDDDPVSENNAAFKQIAIPMLAIAAVKLVLIATPLVAVFSIVPCNILSMHLNFALDISTAWVPFL